MRRHYDWNSWSEVLIGVASVTTGSAFQAGRQEESRLVLDIVFAEEVLIFDRTPCEEKVLFRSWRSMYLLDLCFQTCNVCSALQHQREGLPCGISNDKLHLFGCISVG